MKKKARAQVATPPAYKFVDRRGTEKQASLYPSPSLVGTRYYRPRYYAAPTDTSKAVNQSNRLELVKYSRELFSSLPNLGGAILAKNSWAFSDGWFPIFRGANQVWGDQAEKWLVNSWYNLCNVAGPNYDFRTSLYTSGISLDVDGDSLMVLVEGRDGWPFIAFIPSHRIGNRYQDSEVIEEGRYAGYTQIDGVVLNKQNRPIAYHILGDTADGDYFINTTAGHLLYEPEFQDTVRGVPKTSRTILDFLDTQDINEFTKRAVKLESTFGVIHSTPSGEPDAGANILTGESTSATSPNDAAVSSTGVYMEQLAGGEILYMKAGSGEDLKAFQPSDKPTANAENFIARLERGCMSAIGWPVDLLDSSKIGGAAVRLIQDIARKSIRARQNAVEKRVKTAVAFAVSKAMAIGALPANYNDEWYNFEFQRPALITVDQGYEQAADRENLKIGTITLAEIAAKNGKYWQDQRISTQRETEDLIDRAKAIADSRGIDFLLALNLLSQRAPNGISITQTLEPVTTETT